MSEPQTLREAAIQAALDAQATRAASARAVLAHVLQPADVAALAVAEDAGEVVVFGDSDGTTLAVRGDTVTLVTGQVGEWTTVGPVESLAGLGLLLDAG